MADVLEQVTNLGEKLKYALEFSQGKSKEESADVDAEEISSIFETLDKIKDDITRAVLATSKIGVIVNGIRTLKASDVTVENSPITQSHKDSATALVLFWKKSASKGKPVSKTAEDDSEKFVYCGPEPDTQAIKFIQTLLKAFDVGTTGQEFRNEIDPNVLSDLCYEIEGHFREYFIKGQNDEKAYRHQLMTLKSNISDVRNPDFRRALYCGVYALSSIPLLTPLDMASEQKKSERDRDKQNALEACQSDWELRNIKRAEGQFPCSRCKSKKTSYIQMQTRSSDEPMTTYVTCNNCGKRWKF